VNYIDVYYRTGLYPKDLPYTPGVDGSGVVHKVGEQGPSTLHSTLHMSAAVLIQNETSAHGIDDY
jgi:NADPH:quinone reductase-like Zn-dependent oxidoreductase